MKEIKVRFPHYWIELPYDLPLIDLARPGAYPLALVLERASASFGSQGHSLIIKARSKGRVTRENEHGK